MCPVNLLPPDPIRGDMCAIVKDGLVARGKKFLNLVSVTHRNYSGMSLKEGNFRPEEVRASPWPILQLRKSHLLMVHRSIATLSSTLHLPSRIASHHMRYTHPNFMEVLSLSMYHFWSRLNCPDANPAYTYCI